jgi:hypothetical protein
MIIAKRVLYFYANNLLIAKTSNTVDKLNKSKLSGLVNVFTMVLSLVGGGAAATFFVNVQQ